MTTADLFSSTPEPQVQPSFALPAAPGYSVQALPDAPGWRVQVPDGELLYIPGFFNEKISNRTLQYLQEYEQGDWRNTDWKSLSPQALQALRFQHIDWEQDHIRMYGKTHPLPRLTAWYGDPGAAYTYSGIKSEPKPWNPCLLYLREHIERYSGARFNSVLLNWYRNGEDYLNWHTDDEKELGTNPTIASVNFGETRDFQLRRNSDHQQKITIALQHGTLLLMQGALQHHWEHAVPVRKRVAGSRFNLTFRLIHF